MRRVDPPRVCEATEPGSAGHQLQLLPRQLPALQRAAGSHGLVVGAAQPAAAGQEEKTDLMKPAQRALPRTVLVV